ncbi:MAG TPA: hypothetical protein VIK14_13925 [Ignavibacteria bacterium]
MGKDSDTNDEYSIWEKYSNRVELIDYFKEMDLISKLEYEDLLRRMNEYFCENYK